MATLETRGSSRNTGAYPSLPTALDRRFRIRDDRQAVGALSDAQRMGPHVAGAGAVGGDAMTDIAATEAPAELEHLPGGRNAPSARSPIRSALEISRISAARSAAVTAKLRRTRARAYVTRTGAKTCFCLWSHLDHLDTDIPAETKLLAYLRRRLQLYQLFPDVEPIWRINSNSGPDHRHDGRQRSCGCRYEYDPCSVVAGRGRDGGAGDDRRRHPARRCSLAIPDRRSPIAPFDRWSGVRPNSDERWRDRRGPLVTQSGRRAAEG
jgi:hypothetical protein